jgi:endogenous inhibitor of DNA gyrase (YacG/DUF329 family)
MECPVESCTYTGSEKSVNLHKGQKHGPNTEKCDNCGEGFECPPSRAKKSSEGIFCGLDCKNKYKIENEIRSGSDNPNYVEIDASCAECGKKLELQPAHNRRAENNFCSKACQSEFQKVEQPDHDWRSHVKWRKLREHIYNRDGRKCVECGTQSELHAHHIIPVSEGGEKYKMENIKTLCESCHMDKH